MNKAVAFLILAAGLGAGSAAFAQSESASGAQVVYDPMTNTTRVTDPLFHPQTASSPALAQEPIRLHMPKPHVVHHRAPVVAAAPAEAPPTADMAETEPAPTEAAPPAAAPAPAPVEAAPLPPAPKPKVAKAAPPKSPAPQQQAKAAPPPQNMAPPAGPDAAIPFSLDSGTADLAPEPKHGKQTRVASTEQPAPQQDGKHVRIIFSPEATEPTPETAASVASVAANINTGLRTSSDRVLLQAYGGSTNDKSSNARRLCLKRALSVRQLLIDAGIPSDRIDVRAMGGATLGDPPDRVDMIVHG